MTLLWADSEYMYQYVSVLLTITYEIYLTDFFYDLMDVTAHQQNIGHIATQYMGVFESN